MNLRTLAEADNAIILEDDESGFGVSIKLTDPGGPTAYEVTGQYHRIGAIQDPETGMMIAGNHNAVTIRLSSLGVGVLPARDWEIETTDITGAVVKGHAQYVLPDRTAGRVTMIMRIS